MSNTTPTDPMASYKAQAKLLRAMLSKDGITVPHSEALERTAQLHGARDWNVLCARVKAPEPTVGAFGINMGPWSICDWRGPDEVEEGKPHFYDMSVAVDGDGIWVSHKTAEDDLLGVKVEVENGTIRFMIYDERFSESPAVMTISEHGVEPVKADFGDHMINTVNPVLNDMLTLGGDR